MLTFVDPSTNNGSDVAPATIVRVWHDGMVNLKVHHDAASDSWKTSVSLHDTREAAEAAGQHTAYWPPRV